MKSIIQIVALLAVLVGGVFGITFLTQFTRSDTKTADSRTTKPVATALIKCPEKTADWGKVTGIQGYKSLEIEKGSKGHYDFLFLNLTDKPINIVREPLANCSCTNTNVLFGVISEPESAKLMALDRPPSGPQIEPYLSGVQWKPLDADANSGPSAAEMLPASAPGIPRYGVIRFDWEAMHEKRTTVKVNIVARQGPAADYLTFEVPITVGPPVYASTSTLTLGDINPGEKKEASLVIWSPTRDHFDATAQLLVNDPCIQVAPPRPLTVAELAHLPTALLENNDANAVTRTRCAYLIKVTAYERLGDNQLELGPFARRLIINRGTDTELLGPVIVSGTVRGPIEFGEGVQHDRIDFRVFRSDQGAEKSVEVKSSAPGLQLSVDHVTPDSIQTELKPSKSAFGAHTWKLTVVIPADSQAGPLPSDSAVYLKTNSSPPRRVRIPILGNASG